MTFKPKVFKIYTMYKLTFATSCNWYKNIIQLATCTGPVQVATCTHFDESVKVRISTIAQLWHNINMDTFKTYIHWCTAY